MRKRTFLMLGLVISGHFLFAQKPVERQESNTEIFSEKAGSVVQRGFEPLGTIARCKFELMHIKDLISGHSIAGIRLETTIGAKSAVLDADEVGGLITSIHLVKKATADSPPLFYTEINYRSRDGFSAGAFYDRGKWTPFMKLISYDSDTFLSLNIDDLDKIVTLLEAAKDKLTK